MKTNISTKIEAGLVFSIPLANGAFGFGHLIAEQDPIFYMVAYDVQSATPDVPDERLKGATAVLMGNFFDVLIESGRWLRVRHLTPPLVPYPCFMVKIGNASYVAIWDRSRQREATAAELVKLKNRTDYAPIILEHALNAYFGLSSWESIFDQLRAEVVAESSTVC